jgi:hypothetical protein
VLGFSKIEVKTGLSARCDHPEIEKPTIVKSNVQADTSN